MRRFLDRYRAMPVQAKAALWFIACSFLEKGITVLSTPIFARLLTTAEYGRFNAFMSWFGILSVFVTLSLHTGVFSQAVVKFEEDRNRFISSMQGLALLLAAAWTAVYLLFMDMWNTVFNLTTVQMLCLLGLCWTSAAWGFWITEQRVLYKYKALVGLTLAVTFLKPALGVALVVTSDDKVTARILGMLAVELAAGIYCCVTQTVRGKKLWDKKYWKYMVVLCIPLIPHFLSQTVLNNSDRIMIERLVSEDKAGIYGLAYSISTLMTLFNTALGQTLSPWMFKKMKDRQAGDIAPVAYGTLAFIAVMNLLLMFLGPEAVRIFAPAEYYEAIWTIPPVAMSAYLLFMFDLFARFEFYYEKTTGVMMASILGAALNVGLNFPCIPACGYIAAGYTTLFCYLVTTLCHYALMRRACRLNGVGKVYDEKKLAIITAVFMAAGFAVLATYNVPWLRFSLLGAVLLGAALNFRRLKKGIRVFMNLRRGEDPA